jgi:hypothetical protein
MLLVLMVNPHPPVTFLAHHHTARAGTPQQHALALLQNLGEKIIFLTKERSMPTFQSKQ